MIVDKDSILRIGLDHAEHTKTPSLGEQSLLSTAELIYHEARAQSMIERNALSESISRGASTDLGNNQRVWDFFYPDYNCPLLKERIGRIGNVPTLYPTRTPESIIRAREHY